MSTCRFILSLKFAFAVLLALTFLAAQASNVSAKTKKVKYGTIKILTNPGGLFFTIDGKPRGETKTEQFRAKVAPCPRGTQVGSLWPPRSESVIPSSHLCDSL